MNGRFLLVVLAVVLAGCGAVLSDGPRTGTATLTPAPVPEYTPTEPGLDADTRGGAGDVDALVRTHLSILRERSYTFRRTVRYGDRVTEHVLRVEWPRTYLSRTTTSTTSGHRTEYADGRHLYSRNTQNGTAFDRTAAPNATDRYGELATGIARLHLPGDAGTVVEIRYLGEPHFRLRATYDVHPEFEGVENYSVRARITQGGLIRSMTVSYVRAGNGARTNVTERFTYVRLGATSVDRPVWVDEQWNDTK